jgi:TPR repeat protein
MKMHCQRPLILATCCVCLWGMALGSASGAASAPSMRAAAVASGARAALADYDRGIRLLCSARGRPGVEAEAARWMLRAAEQGHAGAQSVLGWMYMAGKGVPRNDTAASRWLQPSAAAGNTAAQNNLGLLYATGQGLPHDHARAAAWFRAAADQGSAEAARNLHVLIHGDDGAPAIPRGNAATAPDPRLLASNCRL